MLFCRSCSKCWHISSAYERCWVCVLTFEQLSHLRWMKRTEHKSQTKVFLLGRNTTQSHSAVYSWKFDRISCHLSSFNWQTRAKENFSLRLYPNWMKNSILLHHPRALFRLSCKLRSWKDATMISLHRVLDSFLSLSRMWRETRIKWERWRVNFSWWKRASLAEWETLFSSFIFI